MVGCLAFFLGHPYEQRQHPGSYSVWSNIIENTRDACKENLEGVTNWQIRVYIMDPFLSTNSRDHIPKVIKFRLA